MIARKKEEMADKITIKKMFEYLDDLRESGVTNMFFATPYLQEEFGLSKNDAEVVVIGWIITYSERLGNKE